MDPIDKQPGKGKRDRAGALCMKVMVFPPLLFQACLKFNSIEEFFLNTFCYNIALIPNVYLPPPIRVRF